MVVPPMKARSSPVYTRWGSTWFHCSAWVRTKIVPPGLAPASGVSAVPGWVAPGPPLPAAPLGVWEPPQATSITVVMPRPAARSDHDRDLTILFLQGVRADPGQQPTDDTCFSAGSARGGWPPSPPAAA